MTLIWRLGSIKRQDEPLMDQVGGSQDGLDGHDDGHDDQEHQPRKT